jgi:hypothetical protein
MQSPGQLDGPFLESLQKVKARRGSLFCSLSPMRGTLMVQALKIWISDFGQYWLTEQIPDKDNCWYGALVQAHLMLVVRLVLFAEWKVPATNHE